MKLKLSIITINLNNATGLFKTIESLFQQTSTDFELIVVDGGSTDGSIEVIHEFEQKQSNPSKPDSSNHFSWTSEPDTGIYNAMTKGIRLAKGEYVQFLNSGDGLATKEVTLEMMHLIPEECDIFYGNMLKQLPDKKIRDRGFEGRMPTMLDFYIGTLNHSTTYIRKSLFDRYGLYDESLKIVADWKWFLIVIALNNIVPVYKDIDVSVFDMTGISSINSEMDKEERRKVLSELLPSSVLADYDCWASSIDQIKRLNRYGLIRKGFWLAERILFKWEKMFRIKEFIL